MPPLTVTKPSTLIDSSSSGTGPLLSIFYCEFDNVLGPVIRYRVPSPQAPPSVALFDRVQDFLIPKQELAGNSLVFAMEVCFFLFSSFIF